MLQNEICKLFELKLEFIDRGGDSHTSLSRSDSENNSILGEEASL